MWLPCDCSEELQRTSVVHGGEESWGWQSSCSCNGGHGGSSAFEVSGGCGCSGSREGSRGLGGRGGSSGKGHGRGSHMRGRGGKDGVQGRKGRNSIDSNNGDRGRGEGGAGANGGEEGGGNNEGDSDFGDQGGTRGSGDSAIVGKSGLLQNMHSLWAKLYDYCGPVGLWNLALAMLVLGYYGKSYYWDSMGGGGYSLGGGRQVGGKIKCAPKAQPPCCCTCADRPRILKHRLKWPEEEGPCRCRI